MSLDGPGTDPGNSINDFLREDLFPSRVEPTLITVPSLSLPTTWEDVATVLKVIAEKYEGYTNGTIPYPPIYERAEGSDWSDFIYRYTCLGFALNFSRSIIESHRIAPPAMFSAQNVTFDVNSGKITSDCTYQFDVNALQDSLFHLVHELTYIYRLPSNRKNTPLMANNIYNLCYDESLINNIQTCISDGLIDPLKDFLPQLLAAKKGQIHS